MATNKRQLLEVLRREIDTALGAVVDNNRDAVQSLKIGRITYDDNGFTAKLEATFAGGRTKEEIYYEQTRESAARDWLGIGKINLPPLGTIIEFNREPFQVVGANRGGRVIIKRVRDGARLIARMASSVATAKVLAS